MQEALKNARFTILRSFSKFVKQSFSVLNVNVARPYFWNFKLGFRNSGTINIIDIFSFDNFSQFKQSQSSWFYLEKVSK